MLQFRLSLSNTATVSIDVYNNAPVAYDATYTVLHDTTLSGEVYGYDLDGDPITAHLVNGPTNGTVAFNADGTFSYTPSAGYVGDDSFTFRWTDGLNSSEATVWLDVYNTAPVACDAMFRVSHDVAFLGRLNGYDPDGDPLTAQLVSEPSAGSVILNEDGSFVYTADMSVVGTVSFSYTFHDGIEVGNIGTVVLEIENGGIVGVPDWYVVAVGQTLSVDGPGVLANDQACGSDYLEAELVLSPMHGTVTLDSSGSFSYMPLPGFLGKDSFIYRPFDGEKWGTETSVTITVHEQEPMANDDEYVVPAGSQLIVSASGVLSNDWVPEGQELAPTVTQEPTYGELVLSSDGSFLYQPRDGFAGTDFFTYQLVTGVNATVTIHVVKIELQMAGVDPGKKLSVGGFVPINADNDNGSPVRNEIPQRRDFMVSPIAQADNDLIPVEIRLTPNQPLPGFFLIRVIDSPEEAGGRLRLWSNAKKEREVGGVYTWANLPRQFYVEGLLPSWKLRDLRLSVQYYYFSPEGVPTAVARDDVAITVTPVIDFFNLETGEVVFRRGYNGSNRGTNGVEGMQARNAPLNSGATYGPGAYFNAKVVRTGLEGNLRFIQNVVAIRNGFDSGSRAALLARGTIVGTEKYVIRSLDRTDPKKPRPVELPVLDTDVAHGQLYPDYTVGFRTLINDQNVQQITADDSPSIELAPDLGARVTEVDYQLGLRLYLVWRWGEPGKGIIFTLASLDWEVVFRADTYREDEGVTRIKDTSGVFAARRFKRLPSDPVVSGPTANELLTLVRID